MTSIENVTRIPELLAPAGDMDALRAALSAGADAVYLGGRGFNARASAGNFDHQELLAARDLTARLGKKAYVTFNTLVGEREIEAALQELEKMYLAGFDAVIMQDIGLAALVRRIFPTWNIHASTQMTVHNLAGARQLMDAGYTRIIPARELTIAAIKEFADAGIPVEIFAHGAICFSYSGQCLMSSFIGGRSGNRGNCAQPCRMEYSLAVDGESVNASGNFLLSTKDLNLSHRLPELAAAGVTSLKIEGRMKRPEYVWTVTSVYRRLLDSMLDGSWSESLLSESDALLEQAFSRGFTEGKAFASAADVLGTSRPNNRGVCVGRVVSYQPQSMRAEIKLDQQVNQGDGIEVWVTIGGRVGASVDRIWVDDKDVSSAAAGTVMQVWIGKPVFPGDRVFRNQSSGIKADASAAIEQIGIPGDVGVKFSLSGNIDEHLVLRAEDELGFKAEISSQMVIQRAQKRPLNEDIAIEKLGRLGESGFFLQDFSFAVGPDAMIPVSELNRLRREAVGQLRQQRFQRDMTYEERKDAFLNAYVRPDHALIRKKTNKKMYALVVDRLDAIVAAAELEADLVLLPMGGRQSKGADNIVDLADAAVRNGLNFALLLPRINYAELDWDWIRICGASHVYAANLGDLRAAVASGVEVWADWSLNVFNSLSLEAAQKWGIRGVALSPELSLSDIIRLAGTTKLPLEVQVYGRMELMISEYCILQGDSSSCAAGDCREKKYELVDNKEYRFPVEFDDNCRMHLFNSKVTAALAEQESLWDAGINRLRLDLSGASDWQVRKVLFAYRQSMERGADLARIRLDLQDTLSAGLTRGHLQRGVVEE